MSLKILNVEDQIQLPPEIRLQLGLEKEGTFDDYVATKGMFGRFSLRILEFLLKRLAYIPTVYFEKEDVDESIVRELMKHPKELQTVLDWVCGVDYDLLPAMREANKVFSKIQRPKKRDSRLYRGFKLNAGQQTLGLEDRLDDLSIGDSFFFTPDKLLSFSSYQEVTKSYGDVVVTADWDKEKHRMIHITNEVVVACFMQAEKLTEFESEYRVFSYFESVFLPDNKPLRLTLLKK